MICPRCGNEEFAVYRTERNRSADGAYSAVSDRRIHVCEGETGCGLIVATASVMELVQVYDENAMRSKWVSVADFKKKYAMTPGRHGSQLRVFED